MNCDRPTRSIPAGRALLAWTAHDRRLLTLARSVIWWSQDRGGGIDECQRASVSQRAKFEGHHASGTRARLALTLLLYTAQRRGDVVRMGHQHIGKDAAGKPTIRVRQNKTKTRLVIPMHPKLRAEIQASGTANNLTFILTNWGKPYGVNGFGNWFREVCDEAGLHHLSAHGLRKAAARRLAEAGCTPHQIQAITGHKSLAEVVRYTIAANQERMAREAIDRIDEQ